MAADVAREPACHVEAPLAPVQAGSAERSRRGRAGRVHLDAELRERAPAFAGEFTLLASPAVAQMLESISYAAQMMASDSQAESSHYTLALCSEHSPVTNVTIWSEAGAGSAGGEMGSNMSSAVAQKRCP